MTIVEPVAVAHSGCSPVDGLSRHTHVDISQDELVQLIRQMRYEAYQAGRRIPGRPALTDTIGVSPYRVRQALEEIVRVERSSPEGGRRPSNGAHTSPNGVSRSEPAAGVAPITDVAPVGATPPHQDRLASDALRTEPGTPARFPDAEVAAPSAVGSNLASSTRDCKAPAGARGFYAVAAMSMLVSMNTSWRFFEHNLHITDLRERVVLFAVLEVGLLACGWGMRANVRRTGRPGAPRVFAWLLCGMAGYMAWQLSGLTAGIARVALGPALGLVMLHLALGIEIRARHARTTIWARVGGELRERLLSRLGLADDERDALARTRDRAARRVARLSLGKGVWFRTVRVARALRMSNMAHDPVARGADVGRARRDPARRGPGHAASGVPVARLGGRAACDGVMPVAYDGGTRAWCQSSRRLWIRARSMGLCGWRGCVIGFGGPSLTEASTSAAPNT